MTDTASQVTAAVNGFLQAWLQRDWQAMMKYTQRSRLVGGLKRGAKHFEQIHGQRELADYKVGDAVMRGQSMWTVQAEVTIHSQLGEQRKRMAMNVIYEDDSGCPLHPRQFGGHWGVNDITALRMEDL